MLLKQEMRVHFPLLVNYTVENTGRMFPMRMRGQKKKNHQKLTKQLKAEDKRKQKGARRKPNAK